MTDKELDELVSAEAAARIESLAAQNAALTERVEKAERDAGRLDWFDTQRQDEVDWSGHPEEQPVLRYCYWQIQAEAMDIRSAIDAAIAREKEGK